eukprot:4145930-Lingulodinium_polyedra.AAC.1
MRWRWTLPTSAGPAVGQTSMRPARSRMNCASCAAVRTPANRHAIPISSTVAASNPGCCNAGRCAP